MGSMATLDFSLDLVGLLPPWFQADLGGLAQSVARSTCDGAGCRGGPTLAAIIPHQTVGKSPGTTQKAPSP